jgi:hypothetical protein
VYFEKYVKGKMGQTLWIRNLQLSIYGVPLAFMYSVIKDGKYAPVHARCGTFGLTCSKYLAPMDRTLSLLRKGLSLASESKDVKLPVCVCLERVVDYEEPICIAGSKAPLTHPETKAEMYARKPTF